MSGTVFETAIIAVKDGLVRVFMSRGEVERLLQYLRSMYIPAFIVKRDNELQTIFIPTLNTVVHVAGGNNGRRVSA